MSSGKQNPAGKRQVPVFAISCCALGLMAFTQLLVAGVALATRYEESKIVRTVIKEVPKLIAVRIPANGSTDAGRSVAIASKPPVDPEVQALRNLPAPTPVSAPQIADARSERLVKDARQARIAGDMGLAIMKLEEANLQSPEDPTVHYEMGLVHEEMGVTDIAAAHYQKILDLGATKSGTLFRMAADKLRDGFAEEDARGKLSLGRPRVFKAPLSAEGEQIILTVQVQKAPGEDLDLSQVSVDVTFFNRTSKGVIDAPVEQQDWVKQKWTSLPFDFAGGSEETLQMNYLIPPQDTPTEHLFGERKYYGQVVSLLYKGEVVDVQAWPRDLVARIPQQPSEPARGLNDSLFPEFQDTPPAGFDQLLPPLQGN